ncbi:hypothetical protein B0J14DRAFT_496765, partial [Halenospora varia]
PLPLLLLLSAPDARDGFIHLSTSAQILGTLNNFFSNETHVYILRIKYKTIAGWIKWYDSKGKQPDKKGGCWDITGKRGFYPHIYNNATGLKGKEKGVERD